MVVFEVEVGEEWLVSAMRERMRRTVVGGLVGWGLADEGGELGSGLVGLRLRGVEVVGGAEEGGLDGLEGVPGLLK